MDITAISDLHGHKPKLEGGDLLIVAGDLTARNTEEEFLEFNDWLMEQKYPKKIVIGGNHDGFLEKSKPAKRFFSVGCYLQDSGEEYRGLKIWGSPWTLRFPGQNPECMAFCVDMEIQLQEKWEMIPDDTDILVTHSPAYGMLDMVNDCWATRRCGSTSLMSNIRRITPKLHVFGHIHSGYGIHRPILEPWGLGGYPISVNAAIMDEMYRPDNAPIRVVL